MLLDSGHRSFEPGDILSQDSASGGDIGGGVVAMLGINSDGSFTGSACLCDAPAKHTQDAVEVDNRLGAQLLGAKFVPRSGPAPPVLMWRDENTSSAGEAAAHPS